MAEASAKVDRLVAAVAADYRRQIEEVNATLADPEMREQAIPALRGLLDRIGVTPAKVGRGVDIKVEGRLAAMLALTGGKPPVEPRTVVMERVKGIEPSS